MSALLPLPLARRVGVSVSQSHGTTSKVTLPQSLAHARVEGRGSGASEPFLGHLGWWMWGHVPAYSDFQLWLACVLSRLLGGCKRRAPHVFACGRREWLRALVPFVCVRVTPPPCL